MTTFASQSDLKPRKISFRRLSKSAYAFTAEGDPNTGVIVGDDGVMVIDTRATPLMAREGIRRIRRVTSKPIKYVVLSHYHAVRVLGASAYRPEQIIASRRTLGLIRERGKQDMASEIGRFRRLAPGRGPALSTPAQCEKAIRFTQEFVRGLYMTAKRGAAARRSLKQVYEAMKRKMDPVYGRFPIYEHCMPFDVSRAYDEARGIKHPRIWTARRDVEMWKSIA